MVDFLKYNSSTHPLVRLENDWNNLLDHGLEKGYSYLIRKNGSYYEALKGGTSTGAGTIVYGGASDAGGATGTELSSVANHALDAIAALPDGGLLQFQPGGNYELVDPVAVDISYAASKCLKPTLNTIIDLGGSTITVTDGLNTLFLLGSYYIGQTDEIDVENVTIRNGTLAQSMNMASGIGICTEGDSHVKNVLLQNLNLEMLTGSALNFAAIGMEFSPTSSSASYVRNVVVDNCTVRNVRTGVQLQQVGSDSYNTQVSSVHVRNSRFENCQYGGFWLSKTTLKDSSIENNDMINCGYGYGAIFLSTGTAVATVIENVHIKDNRISSPDTTPALIPQYGIYVSDYSKNVKILNNTVDTTVLNPIFASANHINLEIANNTLHSEVDATKALIYADYDLSSESIFIHDNTLRNLVNQNWLDGNPDSPVTAYNNIPDFPLVCVPARTSDVHAHMANNFGLTTVDRAGVAGVTLGNGVNHIDVALSAEMQAKLYIAATPCAWGYYINGLTTTWNSLPYVPEATKTATGFIIQFSVVTPDANQKVYYNMGTVV